MTDRRIWILGAIVDNNNLRHIHRLPYIKAAENNGYTVVYVTIGEFTEEAAVKYARRTKLGVPEEHALRQLKSFEPPGSTRSRAWSN